MRGIGGSGGPAVLSLSSGGTFTRSTEGSVLTDAPTDGSTAFLAWLGVNARRIGLLGLLMEGSRTNYLLNSRDLSNASWTAGTATTTTDQNGGPDAAGLADRVNATSGQFSRYSLVPGPAGLVCASAWARAVTGTASFQTLILGTGAALKAGLLSATTSWGRASASATAAGTSGIVPLHGGDQTAVGGQVATAQDCYLDLVQLEAGGFPTSAIRTTAGTVTRGADVLSYATGSYPVSLLDAGFQVVLRPLMTSAELIAANIDMRIVQVGAADYLRLRVNAGAANLDLVCGGVVKGTLALTFTSRDQALTITVRPTAGTLTLSGATTGDGTNTVAGAAWAAASTLYIGADNAGTNPLFGHIGDARMVLL